uniref:GED domain-containing protein n=1 Tax=Bionectria ochroleuca TaxID=29856 RepID=A0A8H7NGW8_BIOOC
MSQIVVVGERSSGKSAVLEAISHIRFPINNGGYSKLAIEVLFRPATETSVQVTLQYFDSKQNRSVITQDAFNQNDLSNIIQTAIESIDSLIVDKAFLDGGTCKVEIQGPNVQHPLALVDLPDFRADTESGFSVEKPIFNSIIPDYIGNGNSVILAVMPADQKLASNQANLSRVESIDPAGERTITVITKPDLLNAGSMAEAEYVKLVKDQNKAQNSHLGWHALCNTTSIGGSSLKTRDTVEEAFFSSGAWASVPKSKVGICSLRKRICRAMYSRVQYGLPRVIAAAEEKLRQRECELSKLGAPRSEIEQVRQFLTKVAIDFQFLARDAIQGRYDDGFFGGRQDDQHKLRAQLKTFHRAFQYTLKTRGSSRIIRSKIFMLEEQPPEYLKEFFDKYPSNFPCPITINESILEAELNLQADKYQSSEDMAVGLFREQAKPWRGISQSHIQRVTSLVKAFVDSVFVHLLGSPDEVETTKIILTTFVDPWFEKKERILQEKLAELLQPYDEGYAALLDIEFDAAFSNISAKRVANRMFNPANLNFQGISGGALTEDESMRTQKVIDLMSACYETARKTFAATVITLAVENCFVTDIPGIFTPMMVAKMTDEQLKELAQESEDVRDERESLNLDVGTLRDALNVCKKHKPRAVSVLPTRTPLLESDLIPSPKNLNGPPGGPCQSTPRSLSLR